MDRFVVRSDLNAQIGTHFELVYADRLSLRSEFMQTTFASQIWLWAFHEGCRCRCDVYGSQTQAK